jgi:hypothetical protein
MLPANLPFIDMHVITSDGEEYPASAVLSEGLFESLGVTAPDQHGVPTVQLRGV